MYGSNDKALFDLGTYTFEGREYRLGYSWPMLYAQCDRDKVEILSDLAENVALYAVTDLPEGRPPLGEAYARAVTQGYIHTKSSDKTRG